MKMYKCIGKSKAALVWTVILLSFAGLFIFPEECKGGVLEGIYLCLSVLIPSLFPFFILASFMAESNAVERISPLLHPAAKLLLNMKGVCVTPVIMALIGGYPVGAKAVATLYENKSISPKDAERLSVICCSAGPGFMITFVGTSLLRSKESGIILLISQIISIVTLCIISRFTYRKSGEAENYTASVRKLSVSEALVNSVNSAVKSAAGMCGFVLTFSVICRIITSALSESFCFSTYIVSLLEITNGVTLLSEDVSLEVISALTGFGGICVHLQIFRELKNVKFSKVRFYLYRFIQSAVCLISAKLLLLAFPVTDTVLSSVEATPKLKFYSTVFGSVMLLLTSILFIISLRNRRKI